MPPARITARAEETISRKWGEGSRRMYRRVIELGVLGVVVWLLGLVGLVVGSLDQKNRPSLEGFIRVVRKFWICVRVGVSAAAAAGGCDS